MSSGDVGHFDDAGRLFIDGRDDDMIVSGGENVFPQEVEDLLSSHDSISEAAVFGVDDEKFGQRLKAVVVTKGSKQLSEAEIKKYVKSNLAGYKVPRDVDVRRRAAAHLDRQGAQARAPGGRREGLIPLAITGVMPQRTDIFSLGRMGLTSGEGRRLELHTALAPLDLGGERYTPDPELVPVRLDISRTTGNGYALRLRFSATLTGPCMRCLGPAAPSFDIDAREVNQPGAGDEDLQLALRRRRRRPRPRRLGARRLRARRARPDHLHARLPRPVPALRREPQRRPRARPRGRARPALGEALRDPLRVGAGRGAPLPFRSPMAVPKQKQSHARTNQRRSQHKISAPVLNECPQCHQPRRPHRVCGNCGFYKGREVVAVQHDEHDHDH